MAENDPLVQLSAIQLQPDSPPTSSSLPPSSSSSSESSASAENLLEQFYSPTYALPTVRQRLRKIDLDVPSFDVPWKFQEDEKGRIEDLLKRYSNLEDLEQLNPIKIRSDANAFNTKMKKNVADASLGDVHNLVQTCSVSYDALIKSLDDVKDNVKNIQSFIRKPFEYCSRAFRLYEASASLDDYLKVLGEDLVELNNIQKKYASFQTAKADLEDRFGEQKTERQHERLATYQRPKESIEDEWFWNPCCCCRSKRSK